MVFYHGTSKDSWKKIQEEGILWGRRYVVDNNGNPIKEVDRCTYLTPDIEEASQYGDVVLEVEYDPYKNPKRNNYTEDCWQFRVYEPVPVEHCSVKSIGLIKKRRNILNSLRELVACSFIQYIRH